MALRVVGAGLPRTGTTSLQAALTRLLGAPCYHMQEVFGRPDDAAVWRDACEGALPDWDGFLGGYAAGVDWPVSWFWRELSAAYPDALVLLSRRESAERWYRSMDRTVLEGARRLTRGGASAAPPQMLAHVTPEQGRALRDMIRALFGGAFGDPDDPDQVIAAYERHLDEVRATVPAHRLLEWQPADGWEPLCAALGVPVPDEPFPHENTTADMQARMGRTDP
ncbi:sulfotransferase family protein [Actinomadura sp. ATCC 31491]|uniref:Sulfotransferase family protein n=1 Tax=Actinomadura luzonensis TaxID=2805427 RepID=A0ABT0G2W7_9ACTN|nr:sulfotransferase family protein [Actinomadura luzonensis]MCK2218520.1 sulfotransferase family protein [Actinomadura luzonensis]